MATYEDWRKTSNDKLGGTLRLVTGMMFLMAGVLKFTVPSLGEAFSAQISAANIPFPELVEFSFPVIEAVLGIMLLLGLHARISALIAFISMIVATYVHLHIKEFERRTRDLQLDA
jgi:uncharacterized membrane protein YphA (DoxX/SURF4 family)